MKPKYVWPIKVLFQIKEGNETHTHSNYYLTVEEAMEAIKRTSVESAHIIKATPGTELCTDWDDEKPYCYIRPLVELSPVMFSVDFYMRDWSFKDPNMVTWFRLIYHKYSTNEDVAGVLNLTQIDSLMDKSLPYPSMLVNVPTKVDLKYDDPETLMHWYINAYYIMRNEPGVILNGLPDVFTAAKAK